jgi:hypothetical protein
MSYIYVVSRLRVKLFLPLPKDTVDGWVYTTPIQSTKPCHTHYIPPTQKCHPSAWSTCECDPNARKTVRTENTVHEMGCSERLVLRLCSFGMWHRVVWLSPIFQRTLVSPYLPQRRRRLVVTNRRNLSARWHAVTCKTTILTHQMPIISEKYKSCNYSTNTNTCFRSHYRIKYPHHAMVSSLSLLRLRHYLSKQATNVYGLMFFWPCIIV